MGRTHKEQLVLAKEIEKATTQVDIGAMYWHHKSKEKVYKIIG